MKDVIKTQLEELLKLVNDLPESADKATEVGQEVQRLRSSAHNMITYLVTVSLLTVFLGFLCLKAPSSASSSVIVQLVGIMCLGFSGSAVTALTSCLDRHAKGFELEDGRKWPPGAKGETFNARMEWWFGARPFVGAVVAPVLVWGLTLLGFTNLSITTAETTAFTAFLGGLLAKSLIAWLKDNVFK